MKKIVLLLIAMSAIFHASFAFADNPARIRSILVNAIKNSSGEKSPEKMAAGLRGAMNSVRDIRDANPDSYYGILIWEAMAIDEIVADDINSEADHNVYSAVVLRRYAELVVKAIGMPKADITTRAQVIALEIELGTQLAANVPNRYAKERILRTVLEFATRNLLYAREDGDKFRTWAGNLERINADGDSGRLATQTLLEVWGELLQFVKEKTAAAPVAKDRPKDPNPDLPTYVDPNDPHAVAPKPIGKNYPDSNPRVSPDSGSVVVPKRHHDQPKKSSIFPLVSSDLESKPMLLQQGELFGRYNIEAGVGATITKEGTDSDNVFGTADVKMGGMYRANNCHLKDLKLCGIAGIQGDVHAFGDLNKYEAYNTGVKAQVTIGGMYLPFPLPIGFWVAVTADQFQQFTETVVNIGYSLAVPVRIGETGYVLVKIAIPDYAVYRDFGSGNAALKPIADFLKAHPGEKSAGLRAAMDLKLAKFFFNVEYDLSNMDNAGHLSRQEWDASATIPLGFFFSNDAIRAQFTYIEYDLDKSAFKTYRGGLYYELVW